MRVAVISDIHGNLHALEAALGAIDDLAVDELWCLGDTVGYGARPNECCALTQERADLCLAGNHDLAVIGKVDLDEFAGEAGAAARWTRDVLNDEARTFLSRLEPQGTRPGVELFHASPLDPVWHYVLSDDAALYSLLATETPVVLVGHSHVALAIEQVDSAVAGGLVPAGTVINLTDRRFLLNPGSIGQPRDGDPRAAFLVLDLEGRTAEFRRVDYPIERTQEEIRAAGLPAVLADRLSQGI
jgi:diadenosine tetraphosphatase ApaH/serine/threonine PP2A family protein phosphatase